MPYVGANFLSAQNKKSRNFQRKKNFLRYFGYYIRARISLCYMRARISEYFFRNHLGSNWRHFFNLDLLSVYNEKVNWKSKKFTGPAKTDHLNQKLHCSLALRQQTFSGQQLFSNRLISSLAIIWTTIDALRAQATLSNLVWDSLVFSDKTLGPPNLVFCPFFLWLSRGPTPQLAEGSAPERVTEIKDKKQPLADPRFCH